MKKVLIVDDEQDMLEILRYALEAEGYEVFTAINGVAGMVEAIEKHPDCIILDVMMHNLDGYAFVQESRQRSSIKAIPIIVLTGMKHLRKRFKEEGVAAFFEKPFQTLDLVSRVKELAGST